jgi:threonyl-tRNA synthetase
MSGGDLEIELPDGTRMSVPGGSTALDVAKRIGPGLAKAALAGHIEGALIDLRAPLPAPGGRLRIVTARDPEGGEVIRHSAEHVMADAVKRLWPATQIDVGRTTTGSSSTTFASRAPSPPRTSRRSRRR